MPWLKLYVGDWRSDIGLRMCSLAARGLWIDMITLMHEETPYGSLVVNGKQVTERQLATLLSSPLDGVVSALAELREAGVFSIETDGTIYSRRMRRDVARAAADKANGAKGGNPRLRRDQGVNLCYPAG